MTTPAPPTYKIDWGDGTAPETAVPGATERLHVYSKRGTYTVTVTSEVTGKSATRSVTVEDPDAAPEFTLIATGKAREAKLNVTYPV